MYALLYVVVIHVCVYACVCRYAGMNIRMILCMHIQVGGIEDVWFRSMYVCVHIFACGV